MQKPVWPAGSGVLVVFVVFLVALFSLLLLFPGGGAFAGEETEDDRLTILITASRFAETVDETLAPVTVITRKEIEQKQAATVEEVLRAVPGLTLGNSGGVGKLTSVFLRGTESNHVLVLIDGVKVGSATSGLTPFQDLPLDQIEKIEVVRGPRSSLYGSEAIGGVIQIFTRKGQGEPRPRFSVSVGSHDTKKTELGVSGSTESIWYNLGASALSTDGFDACTGDEATFQGCSVNDETDDDDHNNKSFSIRAGLQISSALSLEGNFLISDSETEYDGNVFSGHESETKTQLTSVKASRKVNEAWHSQSMIARAKDESNAFCHRYDRTPLDSTNFDEYCDDARNPVREKVSTFNTTRDQANWQNNFRLNKNSRIVAGIDYQDDKVDSTIDYEVDSRDNTGVFALLRTEINDDDFELSLRNDENEQFGDETTGGIGWGRDFGNDVRTTASYGTAFTVPTFNDLYWPNFGNPDLEPESSESFDLGVSYTNDKGKLTVNFYHTKIDDLIALDDNFIPLNIAKTEITGVEISGDVKLDRWDLRASLTLQDPEDNSGGTNDGNLLPRRAKRIIQLDADRDFGRYAIGASMHGQGDGYDDIKNIRELDGFVVVDLRGEIRIERNWSLGLKINNLFDEEYETVSFYNQDGLNFLATLRYIP